MNIPNFTRVVFLQIRDPKQKLVKLAEIALSHFQKKEHFMIFVEDEKAMHFVDELLWKTPPTSFLPHHCADAPSSDYVLITRSKKNLNRARFAFNLCPTPLLIDSPFTIIYEYEDLTTPSKKQLSSLRFDAYKKENYLIEAR